MHSPIVFVHQIIYLCTQQVQMCRIYSLFSTQRLVDPPLRGITLNINLNKYMKKVENLVRLFQSSIVNNWEMPSLTDYTEKKSYTYQGVAEEIAKLHLLYEQCGIQKGDKISLVGRNSPHWCIVYLATITYGAVIVPILQDFNPNDIHHIVNHSDSHLLFVGDIVWDQLDEAMMPALKGIISYVDWSCLKQAEGVKLSPYLRDLESHFKKRYPKGYAKEDVVYAETSNEDVALISYTSGTTGFSKGVMTTGKNLAGNIQFGIDTNLHYPGSRCLSFLPLAHAYGAAFDFICPFCAGSHITLLGKIPSPKVILKGFEEVRPNLICMVPLVMEKIYRKQILPKLSSPALRIALNIPFLDNKIYSKVRNTLVENFGGVFEQVIIGGAPLNGEVEAFLRKIKFPFTVGYGMTECAPLISYSHYSEFQASSCGHVLDGYMEARIANPNPETGVGEIQVNGTHVMRGYYKNEEATREVFTADGWLRTGDMGVMDEQGILYIRGRNKTMLLGPSGQNIYPEEIEAKLNNLPCVMESLVIQKDHKLLALVYPDYEAVDSMGLSDDDLLALMSENRKTLNSSVAPYESIAEIQLYPTEFEKTPKKSIKRYLYTSIAQSKES